MKTTAFDAVIATDIENAVMAVFECNRNDIIQFIDSDVKKVVVFILYHHFGFNKRIIGWNYKITHWYVPTASDEVKFKYEGDECFKSKIDLVLKNVQLIKEAV